MIAELTAFRAATDSVLTPRWRAPIDADLFGAFPSMVRRVGRAMAGWARTPVLPYATLWEASLVVGVVTEPEFCKPQRYITNR
jgi:hypothetical protein